MYRIPSFFLYNPIFFCIFNFFKGGWLKRWRRRKKAEILKNILEDVLYCLFHSTLFLLLTLVAHSQRHSCHSNGILRWGWSGTSGWRRNYLRVQMLEFWHYFYNLRQSNDGLVCSLAYECRVMEGSGWK